MKIVLEPSDRIDPDFKEYWRLEWKGLQQIFRYWNWGDEWARHPTCDWIFIHKRSRTWTWEEDNECRNE